MIILNLLHIPFLLWLLILLLLYIFLHYFLDNTMKILILLTLIAVTTSYPVQLVDGDGYFVELVEVPQQQQQQLRRFPRGLPGDNQQEQQQVAMERRGYLGGSGGRRWQKPRPRPSQQQQPHPFPSQPEYLRTSESIKEPITAETGHHSGHHDYVDYGAYTGGWGAFGWYSDHPVGGGWGH